MEVKAGWAFTKHVISVNIGPLMAWWLGAKFNGYTSSQSQKVQNAIRCSCGSSLTTITEQHILTCDRFISAF